MKMLLSLFTIICIPFTFLAQSEDLKLGKPELEDFAYSSCSFDKDAEAVILNEEGKLEINHTTAYIVIKRRIKILKQSGIHHANIQIPFFVGSDKIENISSVKGYTINGDEHNPIKIELDKDDIHQIDKNEYWKEVRFAMPSVKVGSIIDYTYIFSTKNLFFIDSWEFQHELPTERSYFSMKNQTSMDFSVYMTGEKLTSNKNQENRNIDKIELKDIPGVKDINHAYNIGDHIEKIRFQNKYSAQSWKGLVKDKISYLRASKRSRAVKDIASSIQNDSDELKTTKKVLKYIQDNYAWNNFYGQWPHNNLNQITRDKSGSSAELNYLLNLVLNELGIETEMVLLSQRTNGKIFVKYPYLGQFDYLANFVKLKNGNVLFLDAVDSKPEQLQFYPTKMDNSFGLLLNENADFVQFKLPISEFSFRQMYNLVDNQIQLSESMKWNGYFDGVKHPKINLENIFGQTYDTKDQATKTLKDEHFFLTQKKYGSTVEGNIIQLQNPLIKWLQKFKVTKDDRSANVEYDFPHYINGSVVVKIPKGYNATLPENQTISLDQDLVYIQDFKINRDNLVIQYSLLLKKYVYTKEDYKSLKQKLNEILEIAHKPIILKKKQ